MTYRLPFPKEDWSSIREIRGDSPRAIYSLLDGTDIGPNSNFYFRMRKSGIIVAARRGVVRERSRTEFRGTPDPEHVNQANYVVLEQGDGSLATYLHVFPSVGELQEIDQGFPIGELSGFAEEPHLHVRFLNRNGKPDYVTLDYS